MCYNIWSNWNMDGILRRPCAALDTALSRPGTGKVDHQRSPILLFININFACCSFCTNCTCFSASGLSWASTLTVTVGLSRWPWSMDGRLFDFSSITRKAVCTALLRKICCKLSPLRTTLAAQKQTWLQCVPARACIERRWSSQRLLKTQVLFNCPQNSSMVFSLYPQLLFCVAVPSTLQVSPQGPLRTVSGSNL